MAKRVFFSKKVGAGERKKGDLCSKTSLELQTHLISGLQEVVCIGGVAAFLSSRNDVVAQN